MNSMRWIFPCIQSVRLMWCFTLIEPYKFNHARKHGNHVGARRAVPLLSLPLMKSSIKNKTLLAALFQYLVRRLWFAVQPTLR
ncbi:MAG: hypothetical protein LBB76_11345, partial [Azoarcus sp.]|nr:hypothetical protein [Azoarcus sp.]